MKFIIVLIAFIAFAAAAPAPADVEIVKYELEVKPDSHKFDYETSNGSKHEETGHAEGESYEVVGSYRFTDPVLGKTIEVTYTSGAGGFQPKVRWL